MSVEYKDYYKILGVPRTATQEEISKAFRKLARTHHPDLNQGDKKSEARFKEINEANEVLKDPEKRKLYDHLGPDWQHGQKFQRPGQENMRFSFGGSGGGFAGSGFSDFFETLFGSGAFGAEGAGSRFSGGGFGGFDGGRFGGFSPQKQKGRNMEAGLALSLEEAFVGGKKTITLQGPGQGGRSLEVTLPAGVKHGARIRLAGQGDASPSGPAGDLFLKISILPHHLFTLDDADVIYDLRLAPWEAALGVKVRVPTLSGDVDLNIKPGADSGKKLRLRGKGLGSGNQKGDQIIRVTVVVPEATSPEEKELWERLRAISPFHPRSVSP
ncbi:MAG: J domain-containing protein [Desulfovibrio sp.]|jgi:curved DNA-binding protein|nr:J domain-containing protein [Desulfovibrio sp.]